MTLKDFVRSVTSKDRNNAELDAWSEGAERSLRLSFHRKFDRIALVGFLIRFSRSAIRDARYAYRSDRGEAECARTIVRCLDLLFRFVREAANPDITEVVAKNILERMVEKSKLPSLERCVAICERTKSVAV